MMRIFRTKEAKILLGIFLVACVLRFWGLSFGLPRLYLEDEEFFVQPALRVAAGKLDPKWYGAPGQPIIYGTAAIFRIVNKITNLSEGTVSPVNLNYQSHIAQFQTAARALPALLGALTVIPIYFIGSRWNKRAGLWAAALVATSFYLVDESHIIRPDIVQTFFIVWMAYFGIQIAEDPKRWPPYILFGISFGLGVTTKYPTLFFLVPLIAFLVILWRVRKFSFKKWAVAILASLTVAFVSGPYLFLNFQRMLHDVSLENRSGQAGHDALNWGQNLWWYSSHVLHFQFGTFISILVLLTIGCLIHRRLKNQGETRTAIFLLLILGAIAYIICISFLKLHWERWTIPVLTMGLIIAGIGLDFLTHLRTRKTWIIVCLVLLFLAPAVRLIRVMYAYSKPGTIEVARDWVLRNIPQKSVIIREPYTPHIPENDYLVTLVPNVSWYDREYYLQQQASYFITSEYIYGRIMKEAERRGPGSDFGKAEGRYELLFQRSSLLHVIPANKNFTTDQLLYSSDFSALRTLDISLLKGPDIRIYKF